MNANTYSHNSFEDSEDSEDFIDGVIDEVSDFMADGKNKNILKKMYKKIKNLFNSCVSNNII